MLFRSSTPADYYDNGVLVRARRVETTYYSAAEDRYRSRIYDVVDTNENGIIDEGDTVYTVQVGQDGKVERTTATETGERVETREHEQTETHSETHNEEHSTTTEQTVQNKKNVWKFSFSPILSVDIQAPTKVTSLDSQFSAPLAAPMKPAQKIEWASLNSPYLVEKKEIGRAHV